MINFFFETDFELNYQQNIKKWVYSVIKKNNKLQGNLSIIFLEDEDLYKINLTYLNHDFYTDVITFDYSEKNIISGDIFISIPRVRYNAQKFNQTFSNELLRVIIHGVLHLLGYNDKTEIQKKKMRNLENIYINEDIVKDVKL